MEHANVALMRRVYDSFLRGTYVTALGELFSEDVIWHLPGRHPGAGEHRGIDSVLAAIARFDGQVQIEVHDILANDEHAVALLRATGNRRGKRYDSLEVDIYHIESGKVSEFWSFAADQRVTDEFWSD